MMHYRHSFIFTQFKIVKEVIVKLYVMPQGQSNEISYRIYLTSNLNEAGPLQMSVDKIVTIKLELLSSDIQIQHEMHFLDLTHSFITEEIYLNEFSVKFYISLGVKNV